MRSLFMLPKLTNARIGVALATAITVDFVQIILGPVGMVTFFDDVILDPLAAVIITLAVGFHPLLLPTFLIELVPVVDMIPTWTGCTLAVVALRKRAEGRETPYPPATPDPDHMKRATVVEEPTPTERGGTA